MNLKFSQMIHGSKMKKDGILMIHFKGNMMNV
jgi:hypothetical protein